MLKQSQRLASFVSQNIGAGKAKACEETRFTGIGVGLVVGCMVFLLVMFGGDILAELIGTTDVAVIQKRVCISERICTGNNRDSDSVQYGRIFQW